MGFSGGYNPSSHQIVSPRKAITLDYTHKARHLREATQRAGLLKNNSSRVGQHIMTQFVRDHTKNLIHVKKKKWQLNRTKRIFDQQQKKRLEQNYLKQRFDPVAQKRRDLAAQNLW